MSMIHIDERIEPNKVENVNSKSINKSLIEWGKFFLVLITSLIIVLNTIGFTRVSGVSMFPTLNDRDLVFVNKLARYYHEPVLGDVAILHLDSKNFDIVKRIVGVPGDTVQITKGVIYVNDLAVPEISTYGVSEDMEKVIVPKNSLFVVGDNREPGISYDSRSKEFGFIPISKLKGYVIFSVLPFHKIAKILKV
ncbi:signal peptidase I [Bacillus sp. EAC]|uniref:signal peptidase I n=1 Tax=Bacillus sp. EAC TaxID=1978338 RepID=UPI000B450080|nr:signal peptidase I [Bacillus sp. EAC]